MEISLALLDRYGLADHLKWFIQVDEDVNPDYVPTSYDVLFAEALVHIVGSGPFSALKPRSNEDFGASTQEVLAHSPRGIVAFDLPTRVDAMIELFANPSCNRDYLCRMNDKLSDVCVKAGEIGLAGILYQAEKTTWDNEYKVMNIQKKEELKKQLKECLSRESDSSES